VPFSLSAISRAIAVVENMASALHSFSAQRIGIAAQELLEKSNRGSSIAPTARLRSEDKWIVLLFHAVTGRLTTLTVAMLCGSRLC
jgi:hypothetical protein